jgi:MFS family permease
MCMTAATNAPDTTEAPGPLLKHPPFAAYWVARILSQTAQGALLYALLILIADRTDRTIYSSLYVACSIVPALAFGLIGGWVSDRLPQRLTLIVLSMTRAAIVFTLVRGELNLTSIFLVTLGIWTVHQFYSPTESAILARLVAEDRLAAANALANLALTIAQVLGMVLLAPAMLRWLDPQVLMAVVALLYAAPAIFLVRMGPLRRLTTTEGRTAPLALRRGWDTAYADRSMFAALLDGILVGVGLSTLVVILPYYLVDVLGTDAGNTVFIFAPAVLGLVLGLQVAPLLGRLVGHGLMATLGLIGFALAVAGLGLVDQFVDALQRTNIDLARLEESLGLSTRIWATMILSVPAGFCSALTNVAARTVLLARSPEATRGQVIATQTTLSNAIALAPTLLAGVAIDLLDVRPVAFGIAVLLLVGAIAGRRIGGSDDTRAAVVVPLEGSAASQHTKGKQ